MDFDEDCSSETEFDVDSCSETDYCAMSKRYPSVHEDDHYGIQATKSRKRSTEKNDSDQMKQAIRECRSHAWQRYEIDDTATRRYSAAHIHDRIFHQVQR